LKFCQLRWLLNRKCLQQSQKDVWWDSYLTWRHLVSMILFPGL
jgi:hypothetical protein